MSVESYDRRIEMHEVSPFGDMDFLTVIKWVNTLRSINALSDAQANHVDMFFKFKDLYGMSSIAEFTGLDEASYRESLDDIAGTVTDARNETSRENNERLKKQCLTEWCERQKLRKTELA